VQIVWRTARRSELETDFVGDDALQTTILARLMEAKLPILGFQEERVELEDIFMRVTKGIVS
jgi:hypothetical protein